MDDSRRRATPSCARCPATRRAIATRPGSTASRGICAYSRCRRCATQPAGQGGGGGGGGFGGGGNNGPFVLPGTYRATLTVDGKDANTVNVVVAGDRDVQITDADRETWHDTALALHQMQRRANDVADQVNEAWTQFQALQQQTRNRRTSGQR